MDEEGSAYHVIKRSMKCKRTPATLGLRAPNPSVTHVSSSTHVKLEFQLVDQIRESVQVLQLNLRPAVSEGGRARGKCQRTPCGVEPLSAKADGLTMRWREESPEHAGRWVHRRPRVATPRSGDRSAPSQPHQAQQSDRSLPLALLPLETVSSTLVAGTASARPWRSRGSREERRSRGWHRDVSDCLDPGLRHRAAVHSRRQVTLVSQQTLKRKSGCSSGSSSRDPLP